MPKPRHSMLGCGFAGFWAVARGFLGCPSLAYRVATAWFPYVFPLHAVLAPVRHSLTAPPGEPQLTHGDLSSSAACGPRPPGTPVVLWAPNTQLLFWGFCFELEVSDVRPVLGCSWARWVMKHKDVPHALEHRVRAGRRVQSLPWGLRKVLSLGWSGPLCLPAGTVMWVAPELSQG